MREIKFRAWDLRNDRMVQDPYVFNEITAGHYVKEYGATYVFYETWQDVDDGIDRPCHIMQYTGLKDKNKNDIYEGDIIDAWVSRWPDQIIRGVVVWNEDCAAYQLKYKGLLGNTPTDFIHKWHFYEVLGNIYQNPELLNQ